MGNGRIGVTARLEMQQPDRGAMPPISLPVSDSFSQETRGGYRDRSVRRAITRAPAGLRDREMSSTQARSAWRRKVHRRLNRLANRAAVTVVYDVALRGLVLGV